ncbi:hypothetical protein Tco_1561697 [Tanacetum coccineum]
MPNVSEQSDGSEESKDSEDIEDNDFDVDIEDKTDDVDVDMDAFRKHIDDNVERLQQLVVVTAAAQDQRKCSKSLLLLE